ncbi:MAG: hypothetical protein K6T99_06800 [Armatimonadetes bacterium]|nr:hypothetical protein [Armatimonadota bacterium]
MMDLVSRNLLFIASGSLFIGFLVLIAYRGNWRKSGYMAVFFMSVATLALWVLALRCLASGQKDIQPILSLNLIGASLTFHIDSLSAVFLLVVPFVGLLTLLYAVEFMAKVYSERSPARYYPFALLLALAIVGVVTISDLFFFFIFWEIMTLASWALVWFERENEEKVKAAWTYFVVTHVAAACILVAMLVIYRESGSFAFEDISRAIGIMAKNNRALVHILMALFMLGFATKAGMFPLGGWLPQAYPAAPSPASAAFAGSMTKIGIYGIVRAFLEFFNNSGLLTIWGGVIAIFGAISIFVGTLTALREDDSKRVLSFHIIGQIGYMLLGIGTGFYFIQTKSILAVLALIAGLYHVVNHACYKSLLFLNVGAAEYATGMRDLNRMGGLGTIMPITMGAAVVASLSIAGIPPFSGFASKWLIYQSAFQGGIRMPLFLALGLIAMFISIATLASFMKLLGAIFLGQPAECTRRARGEVPVAMRVPQVALAVVCVILGIAPILPLIVLYRAAQDIFGDNYVPVFSTLFGTNISGIALNFGNGVAGLWNPIYALIALIFCSLASLVILRLGSAQSRSTVNWYGGEEHEPEEVRFRAHGFCLPFKTAFAKVYPSISIPKISALQGFRKVLDLDSWLYSPILKVGARFTERVSRTHSGVPHVYMIWQLIGAVIAFAILFILIRS